MQTCVDNKAKQKLPNIANVKQYKRIQILKTRTTTKTGN